MTKIVLYIATSQDGYIADESGGVGWLPQTVEETGGEDYGYQKFYDSVDLIAIGRKTYDQILGFGQWPYPGKSCYIFSRKPMRSSSKDIQFFSSSIKEFIKEIEDEKREKLWLLGGSELIDVFYKEGRIDEFIITIFPPVLNKGIPLQVIKNGLERKEIIKVNSIDYGGGVLQDYYVMKENR